jgi:dTDP-4-dehydrorhamnose reductase
MPYEVYHLANTGMASYYDFVKKLVDLLGVDVKLIRAKDSDFSALGYKPLKTAMRSVKLEPMRPWEDALSEYVEDYLK